MCKEAVPPVLSFRALLQNACALGLVKNGISGMLEFQETWHDWKAYLGQMHFFLTGIIGFCDYLIL